MKKTLLVLLALLMMGKASADVIISVDNITLPQGGKTMLAVKYTLDGGELIQGYDLNLKLPAGMSLETGADGRIVYTAGNCYGGTPSIAVNNNGSAYTIVYYQDTPFTGNTGTLITFFLQCDGELIVGDEYAGQFTKAEVSGDDGQLIGDAERSKYPDSQVIANNFTITIGEPLATVELDEDSEVAPVASDGEVYVHVQRTINANEWSTICLPFAMTAAQVNEAFGDNVELGDFSGYEFTAASGDNTVDHIKMKFDAVTAIEAHHPYIIKVTNPIEEFTVDGVTIDIDDETYPYVEKTNGKTKPNERKYGRFVGNYISNFNFYSAGIDDWGNTPLFLSGNEFWYASEDTQTMKAFRAYFVLQQEAPDMDPAAIRVDLSFNDGEATGISDVQGTESDGLYYNLNGQAVENPAKGLYVRKGKKVIVK